MENFSGFPRTHGKPVSVWCRRRTRPLSLLRASVLQTSTLRAASCFSLNSSSATARLYLDNCSMKDCGWGRHQIEGIKTSRGTQVTPVTTCWQTRDSLWTRQQSWTWGQLWCWRELQSRTFYMMCTQKYDVNIHSFRLEMSDWPFSGGTSFSFSFSFSFAFSFTFSFSFSLSFSRSFSLLFNPALNWPITSSGYTLLSSQIVNILSTDFRTFGSLKIIRRQQRPS